MHLEDPVVRDRATALRETLLAMFVLGSVERPSLSAVLDRVAPEDVASVLGDFSLDEKLEIFRALRTSESQGIVIEETDQQSRRELLSNLPPEELRSVFGEMPVDDLVDHLEYFPRIDQEKIIADLEAGEAREVEELRRYGPDTAGGMMTTEYLSVPAGTTSAEALMKIQGNLSNEIISYVYVTDDQAVLQGVVSIREILRAQHSTPVDNYMTCDPVVVNVNTDREEVAAAVDRYNLSVIPVVDADGRIRGIVTFDDVMDAVQEEHSEDMLRMAGTTAIHPVYEPVLVGATKRLPFLLVTMAGGFGVLLVKSVFDDGSISTALFSVVLAIIPLLSGLSGNVAIVTSTVMVRGLATGEIAHSRLWRSVGHEVAVGLLIGVIVSGAVALLYWLLGPDEYAREILPLVGIGLCVSVAWASLVGALVPVICRLSRIIDPAIASGPFVAMTCDISACFIFLLFVHLFVAPAVR